MSLANGTYQIRAFAELSPNGYATSIAAHEHVRIESEGSGNQTWQVRSAGHANFIVETDPNLYDIFSLSYPSDLADGSPVTTEQLESPLEWIFRPLQQENVFTLSPYIDSADVNMCVGVGVEDNEMVIQQCATEEDQRRQAWEFISIPLD
ncbi:hypothetical protein BDQ12DRAFT_716007 [Crucibulum laeve]|uniref:Ricin B lectin domain-containing protein n=1 Tax=Crucibulum laeve TaxID=68775 RepID=A0A5C3LLJ6_9AGAR|nr:hypothetical protein BDQ12DRAFT_716007 [Crucibulum laeve]